MAVAYVDIPLPDAALGNLFCGQVLDDSATATSPSVIECKLKDLKFVYLEQLIHESMHNSWISPFMVTYLGFLFRIL